mgnify:CR=1 FL=1
MDERDVSVQKDVLHGRKPKILLWDVETSPLLSYTWGIWEQNVIKVHTDWYMLCFSARWLGEKKFYTFALPDFPTEYKKNPESDKALMEKLWDLLDEADMVIAHNGDKFDVRKANTRFIANHIMPPSPYKQIDTLKIAKKYFAFTSNKLADLAEKLGLKRKLETGGFELWLGCIRGDKKAWAKMKAYNKQDVVVLEEVYERLKGWHGTHPNVNFITRKSMRCKNCGSDDLMKRGYARIATGWKQIYVCNACGASSRGELIRQKDNILT